MSIITEDKLLQVVKHLIKGGMSKPETIEHLESIAKIAGLGNGNLEKVYENVLSEIPSRHIKINLTDTIEKWISVTDGAFSVTDCYKELQNVTSVTNRNSFRVILNRLKDKGIIQRVGKRDGVFRKVDDVATEINWWDASENPMDLEFPLEIGKFCVLYEKNIMIVAGQKNSGKTGFMLNFTAKNMYKNDDINYFSSEFPPTELKKRLMKFEDVPLSDWKRVKFKDRVYNFADVINPNGINVVDYMEITDEFYKVSAFIQEIYQKLNKGVCIIALQKKAGTGLGIGGMMSAEKARIYLSLNHEIRNKVHRNWAKIEYGKNRVTDEINPDGLQREYKLVQGWKFLPQTIWHQEGEI